MGRHNWKRENIQKYKEWFDNSISRNITAVMFLIMCLGLGTMGYYSIRLANTMIQSEANIYNTQVEEWITEQECVLQMLINSVEAKEDLYKNYEEMVKYLDRIIQNYPDSSAAFLGDPSLPNELIINSGWIPEADYDITKRDWYSNAIDKDDIIITGPYKDLQTGQYCITFSKRMNLNGKVVGVLGIDYYMDQLKKILGASYEESEYAFLVDEDGTIITHPSKEYCLSNEVCVNVSETSYTNDEFGKSKVIFDYDNELKCVMGIHTEGSKFTIYIVKDWLDTYKVFLGSIVLYILLLVVAVSTVNEEKYNT